MMEESQRRRLVQACLWVTRGTTIAADTYEVRLLVQFIQGRLTIDQVCSLTNERAARPTACKMEKNSSLTTI